MLCFYAKLSSKCFEGKMMKRTRELNQFTESTNLKLFLTYFLACFKFISVEHSK